jgi:hypothetical protein
MVGLLFSALAFATFLRATLMWTGWHRSPDWAAVLSWLPIACWTAAGLALLALAANWARQKMAPVAP